VRILDEDDYRRRLDQAVEISTSEEAGLLLKGALDGYRICAAQRAAEHPRGEAERFDQGAQGDAARDPCRG
jgi:hypothetical protein